MTTITEIADRLKKINSALIFIHVKPDGDTLGCAFSLKKVFECLGKTAEVICADSLPEKFGFLIDSKELKQSVGDKKFDAHIAVDCSLENMFGNNNNIFSRCYNTFNIDHHISNTRFAKYNYVENCSSCCEIMYKLYTAMGVEITADIANRLMLGLCTDSGNFSHPSVSGNTLETAGKLVSAGANLYDINYRMFVKKSKNRALLFAETMSRMKFFHGDKFAVIYISMEMLKKYSCKGEDTEGFVDFPLSIDGVEVSASIFESKEKNYKVSFRSKGGKIDVNEIASFFGGGGHAFASGCMLRGYIEDVIDKLEYLVGTYF